jgi:hypothetical protein
LKIENVYFEVPNHFIRFYTDTANQPKGWDAKLKGLKGQPVAKGRVLYDNKLI